MYIISKYKDYYDGVVHSMGIDKSIVYDRKMKIFESNTSDFPNEFKRERFDYNPLNKPLAWSISLNLKEDSQYDNYSTFIVGFCGKLYLGWKLIKNTIYGEIIDIVYGYDELIKNFNNKSYWNVNIDDIYNKIVNMDVMYLFRRYGSPIFVLDKGLKRYDDFIINPNLKDYEFYKVFDSFTAFQEIQMFIGGVLGKNENDIIDISNDDKLQQYGYDKWSFRKEEHQRKSKKRNK